MQNYKCDKRGVRSGASVRMASAYVLLNVEAGSEQEVLKQTKKIGDIEEAYVSFGVYDLIVKVNAASIEELKELVTYRLRIMDHVRSTLTLPLAEEK
jgi:DNA-binding Lrp family transcriptional regulator